MEAFIIFASIFGFLTVSSVLKHQRKMLELKAKTGYVQSDTSSNELRELTRQIAELRDTTTRYDMSFDSALQRLESRVGNLENKSSRRAPDSEPAYAHKSE